MITDKGKKQVKDGKEPFLLTYCYSRVDELL